MAAGTISVSPVGVTPGGPSIFKSIGEKVKKAKDQAVEARQEADQRIKQIEETPDDELTQEDIVELESLKQKRSQKGYFFKKALKFQATDKIRTTIGKFQRDPELQNDPAATEKERFYAKAGMFRPGEMPDVSGREEKNKDIISYVGKGFQMIMDAIDKVKARVNRTAESSEKTSRTASSTESTTQNVSKSTQNLNDATQSISNISKQELNVQKSELNVVQDAEQRREQAEAEARSEQQSDVAGVNDVVEAGQNPGGGILSTALDLGRRFIGRRFGNRIPGAGRARLARMRAGRRMDPVRRNTQYTAPIGPQPMNSPTPWASEGGGFVPRMPSNNINLSDGGIVASLKPKKQKKLADGGITGLVSRFLPPPLGPILNMLINPSSGIGGVGKAVSDVAGGAAQMLTNPTKLIGEGLRAVLPMNRNVGKDVMKADKGDTENVSKVGQLMTIVSGGMMFAPIMEIAKALPFIGALINASKPIIKPIIEAFGLPPSILGMIFGGSASAATMPFGGFQPPGTEPPPPPRPDNLPPPGPPLTGGTDQFAAVSGVSGSVAINGRENAPVGVEYSPFSKRDVQRHNITITSAKGWRRNTQSDHQGYDFSAPAGTPLYAYIPGVVTAVGVDDGSRTGYGNSIEWRDANGTKHFFGHMVERSPFKEGDTIQQGDNVGAVGNTGRSFGDHLHWEIRTPRGKVDPGSWTKANPITPAPRALPPVPPAIARPAIPGVTPAAPAGVSPAAVLIQKASALPGVNPLPSIQQPTSAIAMLGAGRTGKSPQQKQQTSNGDGGRVPLTPVDGYISRDPFLVLEA